ncbi:hypothetical protein TWF506_008171 [Arthrobotrys conoides]|uniref:Uncharacterized protein n=1 Tax=Arthrobotrys conoides TaxID=74498 RepID=A0AAN8N5H4_9PEZI
MCYHTGRRDSLQRLYPASDEVLRNRDLLKQILYLAYRDDNLGTPKINELRVVSRTWLSLIDSSELLQNISYQQPYQTRNERGKPALCWKYLEELRSAARDIRAIQIDDGGVLGKAEFEAFTKSAATASPISNILLTKPLLQVVYLCFEGYGSILNAVTSGPNFKYYQCISTNDGVRSHHVLKSFIELIKRFYSFHKIFTIIGITIEYEASRSPLYVKRDDFLPNFNRLFDLWQSRKVTGGIPTSSIILLAVASPFIALHGAINTALRAIGA